MKKKNRKKKKNKDQLSDTVANSNLCLVQSVRWRGRVSGCLTGCYLSFIKFKKDAVDCCRLLNVEGSIIAERRNVSRDTLRKLNGCYLGLFKTPLR